MNRRLPRRVLQAGAIAAWVAAPAAALASGGGGTVWVTAKCTSEQYKPQTIVLACADGNALLKHLKWTGWSSSKASGSGTYAVNTCNPSCSAGHFVKYPSQATLTKPQNCKGQKHPVFTHATLKTSRKNPKDFVKSWKLSCPI